ncbi:peptide chain release factor N(5)-glutamine methyltransferase [Echinicola sediminis]
MSSARQLYSTFHTELLNLYPDPEAQQLVFWLFEHFLQCSRGDIVRDKELPEIPEKLYLAFEELQRGKPIQYIIGEAPFYGYEFKVSPAVLIPRNETEELVHLIKKENPQSGLHLLDIGTGSGCIPITLFLEMEQAKVSAIDISEAALGIAQENAKKLKADVNFYHLDILQEDIPLNQLDILVSNPPYVRELEKAQMHQNVLEHEPELALFVSNEDPLVFYRTIAQKGRMALKTGGKLYFEINEALGKEMTELVEGLGYQGVRIHQDLQGKDRILSAIKA